MQSIEVSRRAAAKENKNKKHSTKFYIITRRISRLGRRGISTEKKVVQKSTTQNDVDSRKTLTRDARRGEARSTMYTALY